MSILDFFGRLKHDEEIIEKIENDSQNRLTDLQVLERQIKAFIDSDTRKWQITGERYYNGKQDILDAYRTIIGEGGVCQSVDNLPNNKLIDNQYAKLVDQKVNYQFGKPFVANTENDTYQGLIKKVFNKRFFRTFRNVGYDSLNGGIGWLYPYIDEGEIKFKRFPPYEILPIWSDIEKTELKEAIRVYKESSYEGDNKVVKTKIDLITVDGVYPYVLESGKLIPDVEREFTPYISVINGEQVAYYNWGRVPLVPFKSNNKEIPLIRRVKSLQDAINTVTSMFLNNMQEDARNTILVIRNYGGQNLGELRKNLALYGAVGVDGDGGIDTLTVEVNAQNYKELLKILKDAIISNGRGYDAKDDRMSNNPNQMNIQSMYSDIELDANGIEIEFQAAFEELLYFVNQFLLNTGRGDYRNEEVEIIFNRDMLVNEKEILEVLQLARQLGVSQYTTISQIPFINDPTKELERISEENAQVNQDSLFTNAFGGAN